MKGFSILLIILLIPLHLVLFKFEENVEMMEWNVELLKAKVKKLKAQKSVYDNNQLLVNKLYKTHDVESDISKKFQELAIIHGITNSIVDSKVGESLQVNENSKAALMHFYVSFELENENKVMMFIEDIINLVPESSLVTEMESVVLDKAVLGKLKIDIFSFDEIS